MIFYPKTRRKLRLDAIPTEFLNMSTVLSAHHTNKYMDIHFRIKLKLQRQFGTKICKSKLEQKVKKILSEIFTLGQIKMLLNPTIQKMKWSVDDIVTAIFLRSVSPKVYRHLQNIFKISLSIC
ncbi:hypothetical protein ACFW04_014735 [Cataglyphis niger]